MFPQLRMWPGPIPLVAHVLSHETSLLSLHCTHSCSAPFILLFLLPLFSPRLQLNRQPSEVFPDPCSKLELVCIHTLTHINTYPYYVLCLHTYAYMHTFTHTDTYAPLHIHTNIATHNHTYTYPLTNPHKLYMFAHTHSYTLHTHTHTHTRTHSLSRNWNIF